MQRFAVWMALLFFLVLTALPVQANSQTPAFFAIGEDGGVYVSLAMPKPIYHLDVNRKPLPKHFTVYNKTSGKIVVALYKGTDKVSGVPFKRFALGKGGTANFDPQVVHVKVFKPALIDKHKATQKRVMSNITVTGTPDSPKITASSPSVRIKNNAKMRVKICIYNKNDLIKAVPKKVWFLKPGEQAVWDSPQKEFLVRVFKPELLDRALVDRVCYARDIIGINQSDMTRWQRVAPRSGVAPVKGPITVSLSPQNSGTGKLNYELIGVDSRGQAQMMRLIFDSRRNIVGGDKWKAIEAYVGNEKHAIPPRYVHHGKKVAGGKIGSGAIAYRVVDGSISFRRVWNAGIAKPSMNTGAWKSTMHKTNVPFAVAGSKGELNLFYLSRSGSLMMTEYNEQKNDYPTLSLFAKDVEQVPFTVLPHVSEKGEVFADFFYLRNKQIIHRRMNYDKKTWFPEKVMPPTLPNDHRWTHVAGSSTTRYGALGLGGRAKKTGWLLARSTDGFMYSSKREPGGDWSAWHRFDTRKFKSGSTDQLLVD